MSRLSVKNFSFAYPNAEENTLHELNMEFEPGTFNVVCGKSGCGKSTILRNLKSVLAPHGRKTGEIRYQGILVDEVSLRMQTEEIGFVLQNPDNQVVTDKVWHELAFGLESLGYDNQTIRLRVAEMSSYFGIQEWVNKDVSSLSGGQKQLLNLASVMAMHPKILILDEPTSQLDPIAASDFLETVRKINRDVGTTVILTEHRLQDVIPYADKVFVMDEGRLIASGAPEEIGRELKKMNHGMFLSMPVPMQIYAKIDNELPCPLTISQGRRWMSELTMGHEILAHEKPTPSQDEPLKKEECAIFVKDVWFRYERDGRDVVSDLNMSVKQGEFYAVVGGNGTGKSTTLSLLSRVRQPYRGKILIDGKDIRSYSDKDLYRGILGVLPQSPQSMFIKKTVKEDLYSIIGGLAEKPSEEYSASMEKSRAIAGIANLCGIEHLMERHPYDLSGGEQQKLALAKVLLLRPKILMMDEPTKGMDGEFKEEFGQILRKLQAHGITIFMISHDVEFVAEHADRVGFFFGGNIVTCQKTNEFFAGNSFYTTAANRMARHIFPEAINGKDVVSCLKKVL